MRVDTTIEGDESREEIGAERLRLALLWMFPDVRSHVLEVGKGPWRIGRGADCKIPEASFDNVNPYTANERAP